MQRNPQLDRLTRMNTLDSQLTPPSKMLLLLESRSIFELAAYYGFRLLLNRLPVGDGHPVLVMPGMGGGDRSTLPLKRFLRKLGYRAHGWKLGTNTGSPDIENPLRARLQALRTRYPGRKLSVIGWSMGGLYARELAKICPDAVRCVITLGSPFTGHPLATNAATLYKLLSGKTPEISARWFSLRQPPPVPTSSIYTRTDGVVAWQCCVNPPGSLTENIEIVSSHCGLGHHPLALYAIADRLAQAEGDWTPFQPVGMKRLLYGNARV